MLSEHRAWSHCAQSDYVHIFTGPNKLTQLTKISGYINPEQVWKNLIAYTLKGLGHQMEFLLKAYKIKSELSVQCTCANGFKIFSLFLFKRKINIKLLFRLSFALIGRSSPVNVHVHPRQAIRTVLRTKGGFRNNFQSHRRLSESRSQLPEEGYLKDFHNQQVISQKKPETSFWSFVTKRQPKLVKTISADSQSTLQILGL